MSGHLGHDLSLLGRFLYRFFWSLLWLICKGYFRFSVVGRENLPATGGYILSPVHRSYLDSILGGMATSRRQRFLGKESLWNNRFLGGFLTIVGAFPVERGTADRAALRACQDVLERETEKKNKKSMKVKTHNKITKQKKKNKRKNRKTKILNNKKQINRTI